MLNSTWPHGAGVYIFYQSSPFVELYVDFAPIRIMTITTRLPAEIAMPVLLRTSYLVTQDDTRVSGGS